MTEIMPVPRNSILLSYQQRAIGGSFYCGCISPCSFSNSAMRFFIICSSSRFFVRPSYSAIYPSLSSSACSPPAGGISTERILHFAASMTKY